MSISQNFPWYSTNDEDRQIMATHCKAKLDAWRMAYAHRMELRDGARQSDGRYQRSAITRLQKYWPTIAQAFDELKAAFENAKRGVAEQPVDIDAMAEYFAVA